MSLARVDIREGTIVLQSELSESALHGKDEEEASKDPGLNKQKYK